MSGQRPESWRAKKALLLVRVAGRVVKRRSPTRRVRVLGAGRVDGAEEDCGEDIFWVVEL